MTHPLRLDPDRYFPSDATQRQIAGELFAHVETLPIVSPHGHTDPAWFAKNAPFEDAVSLLLWPDHYLLRMLMSVGVTLESIGIAPNDDAEYEKDRRVVWRRFAEHYRVFRATPSRLWLDHTFATVFGLDVRLEAATADLYYDTIKAKLAEPEFRPRALYERFNIEVIATTDTAIDPLHDHRAIRESGWGGRVIPTFRPDEVLDPDHADFFSSLEQLAILTGENVETWPGYLAALANRRAYFREHGATATDHGHATARTCCLGLGEAKQLYDRILLNRKNEGDGELFRAHMLIEMAKMSCDDGMVMQLHAGPWRNHNLQLYRRFGWHKGGDVPTATDYVHGLKPLLDKYGNDPKLTLILFTLDETAYSRELAPLAGIYPAVKLGPPWWFHDSPDGMLRFRRATTDTAGFYNTAGFNDDTRAFFSIPARHDLARRMDCVYLAELVATHRLEMEEAAELARDLAYNLAKRTYRL
ncbi:MAG TPA: glucuronate isomerase [Rhizomicrobium sp.]|jgi:glucuronate isomerase